MQLTTKQTCLDCGLTFESIYQKCPDCDSYAVNATPDKRILAWSSYSAGEPYDCPHCGRACGWADDEDGDTWLICRSCGYQGKI